MRELTYKNVLLRITDLTDLVDVSANENRIKRIIYKAAIDSRPAINMIAVSAHPIDVVDGIGEFPCDLIRLLRAYGHGSGSYRTGEAMEPRRLNLSGKYDHTSSYIKPSWLRNGRIYIDYYAIPMVDVVEDGVSCKEVAISMEQMDYCAYEAIRTILRDDMARGKINMAVYQIFDEEATNNYHAAIGSARNISIDQMESAAWMMRNAQFFNLK